MSIPRGFILLAAVLSTANAVRAEVATDPIWEYGGGERRRDPFTYRSHFPIPASSNKSASGPLPPNSCGEELLKKVHAAYQLYAAAENALIEGDGAEVVAKADEGLKLFKSDDTEVLVRELGEKLRRIRIAGLRAKDRQIAQAEFDALNIRVTGVVTKERQSQAIINAQESRIVGKGDLISVSQGQEVMVEEIRPEQVVVLYKGYRMILPLAEQVAK